MLFAAEDGSVRAVCTARPSPSGDEDLYASAFDAGGRSLAGWPVKLSPEEVFAGRMIGDTLTLLTGVTVPETEARRVRMTTVAADGTVRHGARLSITEPCCSDEWAVGPDGVAYGTTHRIATDVTVSASKLWAVGAAGLLGGFPVTIKGGASRPAFDAPGRIHVTVGSPDRPPARTLVFDSHGRAVDVGSGALKLSATSKWVGIEGSMLYPLPPLVGADGSTYVADVLGGRIVAGLDPTGDMMAGWPFRSENGLQVVGICPHSAACDSFEWAAPVIGPDNTIFLHHENADAGGSLLAVGADGKVKSGWPVVLQCAGAGFWKSVVGGDGTIFALAGEPEAGDGISATILAIAPDGTVLYRTTIVEP